MANQALADLYNTTVEDLIGKDDSDYLDDKDLTLQYTKSVQEIMKNGETKTVYEDSIDKKTGIRRNYVSIKKPFVNLDGELNILILTNDITDINQANEEIKKKERMLFQQSKMASMGEMLGNIAHQWRQPLSIISTVATSMTLRKELASISYEEEMKYLDDITNTVQYLSQTIDDFRNFFQSDKEIKICKSDYIVEKVFSLISERFDNYNIKVINEVENFEFKTLENELIQVLLNILNNARDALSELDIEKVIFIRFYKIKDLITIEVQDNASGISQEIISKIFEPYFTTKHQSQGTGIGLYMSQEIVQKHLKGELFVENKEVIYDTKKYIGAKFTIKLPQLEDNTH